MRAREAHPHCNGSTWRHALLQCGAFLRGWRQGFLGLAVGSCSSQGWLVLFSRVAIALLKGLKGDHCSSQGWVYRLQVRNLASCIKAAIDFVSPESFKHVLYLTQERRELTLQEAIVKPEEAEVSPTERRHADKLQVAPSRLPQAWLIKAAALHPASPSTT